MHVFNALILAILSVSGIVTALPVAQPHDTGLPHSEESQDIVPAEPVLDMMTAIEARANTPADDLKHDQNHAKQAAGDCGQGCKNSLASYHSQASKDSKASKASKNSKNQTGSSPSAC